MARSSSNSIRKRLRVMTAAVVILMAALILRTAYWQTIRHAEMKARVEQQQRSTAAVSAGRGRIYDRNGKVLAESAAANNLVCNPKDMEGNKNLPYVAQTIADTIDMDYDDVYKALTRTSYQYSVIKKKISAEETDKITALINGSDPSASFAGIYFEENSKRYYPFNIASHVLGWTDAANDGASGVESTFNDLLAGKAGSMSTTMTGSGRTNTTNAAQYYSDANGGSDIVLTIDETIQHFLENSLEQAVKEDELRQGATGIVMNPKTCEILAMATKPDFDNNNYADYEQFLQTSWKYTYEPPEEENGEEPEGDATPSPKPTFDPENPSDDAIADMRNRMWRNKSVTDTYEPGSTFKVITAAAALEEHVVDEGTKFFCPGFRKVEDREIGCANKNGHGSQTFVEGVQNSCNPVFMDIALKLGEEKFMEYFRAFGFTEKTGIELNGESGSLYYRNGMNKVDIATSSFGQGFQITPLQLITAVSAVINGGERMKPHIVKEIRNSEGIVKSYEPEVINRVISEETSDKMRAILESVVAAPGATGKNAYVKGWRIGGKTATSEKMPRGSSDRIASFIGFAPANDPEIICLVVLDEPQVDNKYGGTIAAPIVGELIDDILEYMGMDRQYSEDEKPDETAELPDVRGLEPDEAKKLLVDAGFKYTISGSSNAEEIVSQLPKPGMMLNKGSVVVLYTDDEDPEDTVTVPNLNGMSVSSAENSLLSRNLNFEVAGAGHSEAAGSYAVSQSIKAGTQVSPGTVIGVEFRQAASD